MNKRERLEKTLLGEVTDRVPVVTWRHFPGDDQRAADLAKATLDFQARYDWDFIKVTPASTYSVMDYGIKDEWQGSLTGDRICTSRAVHKSLQWTELRPLNPLRGELGKHLEALRLIEQGASDTPIVVTIYSPLSQAQMLSGSDLFIRNMRNHEDRLRTGLNIITESILRFFDSLKNINIAGIFYVVNHASYSVLSETEYASFGTPHDQKILSALPQKWWLNILSLQCNAPMFNLVQNYPVQAIHWNASETRPTLVRGKGQIKRAVCGGLSANEHLHLATPATVRSIAREAIQSVDARRLILAGGDTLAVTTPLSNLQAMREVVNNIGVN